MLIEAAARGDAIETHALAVRLAHEILSSPVVALAHAVLAGGPHVTAKAIELAELVRPGPSATLLSEGTGT